MSRPLRGLLAVAVLLGGCGGGVHVGSDRTLDIGLAEYRLSPNDVQAPSGWLTIIVHNYGRLTHDLVVAQGTHWLGATKPLPPGQSAQITLQLTPGRYSMFSALLSDQALGQYGTLRVTR
jgi:hypothetical protein